VNNEDLTPRHLNSKNPMDSINSTNPRNPINSNNRFVSFAQCAFRTVVNIEDLTPFDPFFFNLNGRIYKSPMRR
jgi:hypothetical protein